MSRPIPFTEGLLVRIKTVDQPPRFWDSGGRMKLHMGSIKTIRCVANKTEAYSGVCFHMKEDEGSNGGTGWFWRDVDLQKVNTPLE